MKKTTSKSSKSPAPATSVTSAAAVKSVAPAKATKAAKPAAPKAAVAKPAAIAKPLAAKKKPAAAAPVAAPAPVAAVKPVAVKPVASAPVVTTITAQIDIGFGNALYVRGEGAGLSWDKGLLMDCVNDAQWQIALGESARPIVFKFLVNDLSWSAGEDYSVAAGSTVSFVPTF